MSSRMLRRASRRSAAKRATPRGLWWREVGWRHLVAVAAIGFALFPILFVVSAAVNPLGTLSSSRILPAGASADNWSSSRPSTSS